MIGEISLIVCDFIIQVLANRPDIIREDYMNELCVLQDDVPAFPNEVLCSIFWLQYSNVAVASLK